jgi:osmoprotectant transport system permease protein
MEDVIGRRIVEHLLISLLPLLAGVAVGGGLGAVCALVVRALFSALPGLRKLSILLPWRTILMGLLLLIWTPFIAIRLGIGVATGAVTVGLVMFLLALVFTVAALTEHWHPSPLAIRLLAGARTLAAASGVIAAGAGFVGGGGIGFLMIQGMNLLQYDLAWKGWLVIVILALVLDLLLGIVQLIVFHGLEKRDRVEPTISQEAAA